LANIQDIIAGSTPPNAPQQGGGQQDVSPEEDEQAGEVDFPIPDGYKPPASTKPGDEFTALGSFRIDEDEPSMMVLTKIDGMPVSGKEEDGEEEQPPAGAGGGMPPV
jgi:hypothetical protein